MYQIERETEREEKCKAVALVPNSVGNFSQIDDNFLHLTKMGIGPNHFCSFCSCPHKDLQLLWSQHLSMAKQPNSSTRDEWTLESALDSIFGLEDMSQQNFRPEATSSNYQQSSWVS